MSVKDARAMIFQRAERYDFDINADLDRLILEAKAEMPCQWWAIEPGKNTPPRAPGGPCRSIPTYWCPSCAAREKLKPKEEHHG